MKKDMVRRFFRYAVERESVMHRRAQGQPQENWTLDEILNTYRFCNIFREDDKTTTWFRNHIRDPLNEEIALELRDRSMPAFGRLLLATVAFRWFNRIETGEKIDDILRKGWDSDKIRKRLKEVRPLVTGAYMIKTPTGMNKLDGIIWCIEQLQPHADYAAYLMFNNKLTLEQAWEYLKNFPFLGDFMAYEIITDLRHTKLLRHASDINTWANPGPGAARGLDRITGQPLGTYNRHSTAHRSMMMEQMQELLKLSKQEEYWPWPNKPWEMREVEHTLCEFDKYERVRLGEGRPKEKFRKERK